MEHSYLLFIFVEDGLCVNQVISLVARVGAFRILWLPFQVSTVLEGMSEGATFVVLKPQLRVLDLWLCHQGAKSFVCILRVIKKDLRAILGGNHAGREERSLSKLFRKANI